MNIAARLTIFAITLCTWIPTASADLTFTYTKIADSATAVPMGQGTFQEFMDTAGELTLPAIDHETIVFWGRSGQFNSLLGLYQFTETNGIQLIADTNTQIPGNTQNFDWVGATSIDNGDMAFWGNSNTGIEGIYMQEGGILKRVVDRDTLIPGTSGTFLSFGYPSLENGKIAFVGADANRLTGIYIHENNALQTMVDLNTTAPTNLGSFKFFSGVSLDNGQLGFGAGGTSFHSGIFTLQKDEIHTVADTMTPVPGGQGNLSIFEGVLDCFMFVSCVETGPWPVFSAGKTTFSAYESPSGELGIYTDIEGLSLIVNTSSTFPGTGGPLLPISPSIDQGTVAFMGFNFPYIGIYLSQGGSLTKVIDTNDVLDEKSIMTLLIGPYGLSGNHLAFVAQFQDGTTGVYRADFSSETTLQSSRDSFVRSSSTNRNEGANPTLRIQKSGQKRTVVGFDLPQVSAASLSKATLTFTIAEPTKSLGNQGRLINIHRLMESFAEGNGKRIGLPKSEKTSGSGPGVTWNCATDTEISNNNTDCDVQWLGGDLVAGPATDSILHTTGMTGEISWDVTTDVRDALNEGTHNIDWLIRLANESKGGKILYHSKEGAAALGDLGKGPTLLLEY